VKCRQNLQVPEPPLARDRMAFGLIERVTSKRGVPTIDYLPGLDRILFYGSSISKKCVSTSSIMGAYLPSTLRR